MRPPNHICIELSILNIKDIGGKIATQRVSKSRENLNIKVIYSSLP